MRLIFYLLLFLGWYTSNAQVPPFINFNSGEKINGVAFDGASILFATNGGLVEYDTVTGKSVFFNRANTDLPATEITAVAVDADGTRWLGTLIGLIRWENGKMTLLNPPSTRLAVLDICMQDNGDLWLTAKGHNTQLWRFNGQEWFAFDEKDLFGQWAYINIEPAPGGIYIYSRVSNSPETFYYFDGNQLIEYPLPALSDLPGTNEVSSWVADTNGIVFVTTGNQMAATNNGVWTVESLPEAIWAGKVALGPQADLWLYSNYPYGLPCLFQRQPSGYWQPKTEEPAVSFDALDVTLVITPAGIPIVYTYDFGATHFRQNTWAKLPTSKDQLPNNTVTGLVAMPNQNIWATFSYYYLPRAFLDQLQLARYQDQSWEALGPGAPFKYWLSFTDMQKDETGNLWLAQEQNLYRFADGVWTTFQAPGLEGGRILEIGIQPGGGEIWVGGRDKIARFDGQAFQYVNLPDPDNAYMSDLEVDHNGNVWMIHYCEGWKCLVTRFDGQTWHNYSGSDMNMINTVQRINDIAVAPNGDVWVVGEAEVSYLHDGVWTVLDIQEYTGDLTSIAFDGTDRVWIGCSRHSCFSFDYNLKLIKYEQGQITYYPYVDYPFPHPNLTALAVDDYHNLWIGTEAGGIAVFNENGVVVSVDDAGASPVSQAFQAWASPNPARESATVVYELPMASQLTFSLCSMDGQLVQSFQANLSEGRHNWVINVASLPSGAYFWRIQGPDSGVLNGKLIVEK